MSDKTREQSYVAGLVKSLPSTAHVRTKHSLKIALMRLDIAWNKHWQTDHLVAEIERLINDALPKERKAAAKPPIAAPPEKATAVEIQTAPEPEKPEQNRLIIPEVFPDWHYVRISTSDKISISAPAPFACARESFSGDAYDRYLLDDTEKFVRTPLIIDDRMIDFGGRTETLAVLNFIASFAEHYPAFTTNVFLARLKQLTPMEATTRKTVNDFRIMRAAITARWANGLTLFLQGVENSLAGNNELLATARARIDGLKMARLFNAKTGRITFRATKWTDERTAAECKLVTILIKEMRSATTAVDLGIVQTLRAKLNLPPSVCEDLDAHIAKVARLSTNDPVPVRVPKDKLERQLAEQLTNNPFYCLIKSRGLNLPNEVENNPFQLFKWLADLTEKINSNNLDQVTDRCMSIGLNLPAARALAYELALRPETVEQRLQNALGSKGKVGEIMLADVNAALNQIRQPRLRFAFVSFMEQIIRHFADSAERTHHINDRLRATAAHFIVCDDLLTRYAKHLPRQIGNVRLFVLQSAAQAEIITARMAAGCARFDKTSALPCDIGHCLLALLTSEEKNQVNAIAWFREMFSIDNANWDLLLNKYALPKMSVASAQTRDAFKACRDRIIAANAWEIMTNRRGYPFANAAVRSMAQRAGAGRIEILHGLHAAGINVTGFCDNIRSDVSSIFSQIPGALQLPAAIAESQINDIVAKIVFKRVAPRHWPRWITRRAEILLRADALIKQTGRSADRKKILFSLLSAHSHRVETIIEKFPSHS